MSQQPSLSPPHTVGVLSSADVWRIMRRRLSLIIASFVVLGLGGSGGLVAWYYQAPLYTAEGVIEYEPGQGSNPIAPGWGQEIPLAIFGSYVKSQVMAIQNDRILTSALKQLEGKQTMYGGAIPSYTLGKDLQVNFIENTQNIVVRLRGTKKEQVYAIVREVLAQYIKQVEDDRAQADTDRQRELRSERDDLRKQLDELGRKLASLRTESNVLEGGAVEQTARLGELARRLTETQMILAEANVAWTQFQELKSQADAEKDISKLLIAFPEIMDAVHRDPNIASLTDQVARASQEMQGLKQRFGPQHESVKRVETLIQALKNDLETRQTDILGQVFQQQAAFLKSRYDRARSAEAELQARVAEARSAAVDAAKLNADYRAREGEYRRVQSLLDTIMDGLERMRISSALSRPNVRVARWPMIPIEPSEPKLILYIPAAIILSLIIGVGLSLLLELMDTRLRSPAEVVRQVGVPLLANVADLSEDERLSLDTNVNLVSQAVPQSLMAECFRQLRTSLQFAADHPIKSLLITSANPGDGKSAVAANLAITMARSGLRVLLIEANFRRPSLARVFDLPDAVGLSNVLVGMNTAGEAIQATAIENLDVLVGGPVPPSPAELLGSPAMRQLVAEQSRAYDQMVIDGAPMLVVADNHLLAEVVDGVVLVFRANENTRGMAQRAVRQVLSLRARLLGAVLNRVRATKGGYFRKSFQAYYDYSGGASPVQAAPNRSGRAVSADGGTPDDRGGGGPEA